MIFIQTYYIYDVNKINYKDSGGKEIRQDVFIEMCKISNYLLNKTKKELHFWGCSNSIEFVKKIGLKYHKYFEIPKQEKLEDFDKFWTINKIYIASLQVEDFYIVDLDFFLFKDLENPKNKQFYVQSKENEDTEIYNWVSEFEESLKKINFKNDSLYKKINNLQKQNNINIYNTGIFGGRGKEVAILYNDIYKFLTKNFKNINSISPYTNILVEQLWIPMLFKSRDFEIKEIWKNPICWGDFNKKSESLGFCHLISNKSKLNEENIKNIEKYIKLNNI